MGNPEGIVQAQGDGIQEVVRNEPFPEIVELGSGRPVPGKKSPAPPGRLRPLRTGAAAEDDECEESPAP
jgi:hypothetical protein